MGKKDSHADIGQYIAIGMSLGIVFGSLYDNLALGISFGMLFGLVLHPIISNRDGKQDQDDETEDDD